MVELLRRCLADDDGEAWTEFWLLYFEVALPPIRSVLSRAGFGASDMEDVVMDTCVRLMEADACRLHTFRGNSIPELLGWLMSVAANVARNWVRDSRTNGCEAARQLLDVPDHSDRSSEHRVAFALEELEQIATPGDFEKLCVLIGIGPELDSIPERTLRHWKKTLLAKYADRLDTGSD